MIGIKVRPAFRWPDAGKGRSVIRGSSPDHFQQGPNAETGDHSLQIIGEDMEAHLGTDPFQPTRQEVASAHPCLDGSEWVLNRLPADAHGVRRLV